MRLNIKNLSKTYSNGVKALNNVSLEIPNGMFGLLGPNGAGKSTLMRTLATLQEPDQGSITFSDTDLINEKNSIRKILGYLPQEFGVYPKVTVSDLLDHLAVLNGVTDKKQRQKRVSELLQLTNLFDSRNKALTTFSGGMKQRFGIAQALLGDPKLLIVDEPTAGLDPEERARFHNLLCSLSENIVVLLSTHIVSDISNLCSNMAIIDKGSVLVTGRPKNIVSQLEGKVWKKVIGRNDLAAAKEKYQAISSQLIEGDTVIHVYGNDRPEKEFEPRTPDLEDAYFAAIRGYSQNIEGGVQ
jgi:ABC-2 type transport system ATP-binding protein